MNHRHLWGAAAIIALVVIGGFLLSVPHTARDVVKAPPPSVPGVPLVTVRDTYKKGKHTLAGSLLAQNACASVTATSTANGDSILIDIALTIPEGVCLEYPTRVSFTNTLNAPADLPLVVRVNGVLASTTEP
jgi:hypothetical protein